MRVNFDSLAIGFLLFASTLVIAHPQPVADIQHVAEPFEGRAEDIFADVSDLWKRKGGGGGGGKGGSGSSGGKGGSGSSGSGSSGSSGNSGSSGSSSGSSGSSSGGSSRGGRGSSSSSTGGSTKQGSGVQPSYGGGRYYGGGATTPYRSGVASPLGLPAIFLGASLLSLYPGFWPYGAYGYNYHNPYTFHNHSAHNSTNTTKTTRDIWVSALVIRQDDGVEETKPVTCLCAAYQECGCDDNGNTTFLDSLIGDGSYSKLNLSLVNVADINGTSTIILNGSLPNGTTTSGGTENANGAQKMLEASGYWVMIALVGCTVFLV